LLREMQKAGLVRSLRTDEPFTHLAGGVRWDLRVTIVFPDGNLAVSESPAWDNAWKTAEARLYKDRELFEAEEKTRFGLLEEHWDVVVAEVKD
jgi:hypothetical protein